MSFRLYDAPEKASGKNSQELLKLISKHVFANVLTDHDLSMGWTNLKNLLDTDLTEEKVIAQQYLLLGFRVDRKSLSSLYFRARWENLLAEYMEQANTEKVRVDERKHLRETLRTKLLRETEPRRQLYEVCWDLPAGRIYFFSTSATANETFCEHFRRTFGESLKPATLEQKFLEVMPGGDSQKILDKATPATF